MSWLIRVILTFLFSGKECGALPQVHLVVWSTTIRVYETVVSATCELGYEIQNETERSLTCLSNRQWDIDPTSVTCTCTCWKPFAIITFGNINAWIDVALLPQVFFVYQKKAREKICTIWLTICMWKYLWLSLIIHRLLLLRIVKNHRYILFSFTVVYWVYQ
jgi:hypothetical protein